MPAQRGRNSLSPRAPTSGSSTTRTARCAAIRSSRYASASSTVSQLLSGCSPASFSRRCLVSKLQVRRGCRLRRSWRSQQIRSTGSSSTELLTRNSLSWRPEKCNWISASVTRSLRRNPKSVMPACTHCFSQSDLIRVKSSNKNLTCSQVKSTDSVYNLLAVHKPFNCLFKEIYQNSNSCCFNFFSY